MENYNDTVIIYNVIKAIDDIAGSIVTANYVMDNYDDIAEFIRNNIDDAVKDKMTEEEINTTIRNQIHSLSPVNSLELMINVSQRLLGLANVFGLGSTDETNIVSQFVDNYFKDMEKDVENKSTSKSVSIINDVIQNSNFRDYV